jgi:hypothetical protein
VASYEETLTNISLDADASLAFDTSPPYTGKTPPSGGTAVAGFQYRFVKGSGNHAVGLFTNEEGERVVGVLQNKPQVEGMAATVAIFGISLVEAGGTVEAWDGVGSDATGRAVTGGDLGLAVYGGEEGDLIPVLLRLHTTAVPA